jgi:carboxyl-terminal processing protease
MRLTTARYFTPSGRSIQALGIEPDIAVQPAKLEKIATGPGIHEADLKGALANPNKSAVPVANDNKDSKDAKDKAAAPADDDDGTDDSTADAAKTGDKSKEPPFDYQLARALDLIRGIHLFEAKTGTK